MNKLKINIGSGYKRYPDFINIDRDPMCSPNFVVDLEKDKLPFDDNSVCEVKARHILEHLGDGFFHCLQELYRVCEDGAVIDITVPHHRHEYFLNDPTHKRPITVDGLTLFSKKYNDYCVSIDDGSSKLGHYYNVDFEVIWSDYAYDSRYNHMIQAVKEDPALRIQWEQILHENNNIRVETYVKLLVVK